MLFNAPLFSSLLLIPAVLAVPSGSGLGERLARRREGLELGARATEIEYTANWAGVVWWQPNGTFTSVTGTFTVPMPSGVSYSSAGAWVGLDGVTCTSALLRSGVDILAEAPGQPSYHAWYDWSTDDTVVNPYFDVSISTGDTIKLTVAVAFPWTKFALATVENLTTGQSQSVTLVSPTEEPFCGQNAEWIVEDEYLPHGYAPFTDFGTITFTNAQATGPEIGTYGPSGGIIYEMEQNGTILTSTSISGTSVTITYV